MTSSPKKTSIQPWQWALIGSGSTLMIALVGFGALNLIAPSTALNSAAQPSSATQIGSSSATVKPSGTTNSLIGQWESTRQEPRGKLTYTFTPDGYFIVSQGSKGTKLKYQVNATTQPKQITLFAVDNSTPIIESVFEITLDGQLRIPLEKSRQTSFGANDPLFQRVSEIANIPNVKIEEVSQASAVAQVNRGKQSEARTYVGTMIRGQQAFFLENGRFTSDLNALQLGIKSITENYSYSTISSNEKKVVQSTGLSRTEDLKSYTGLVWTKTNGTETTTMSRLCESIQPTHETPSQPQISGDDVACPAGYVDLNH